MYATFYFIFSESLINFTPKTKIENVTLIFTGQIMGLYALYIVNSSGTLIYQRNLDPTVNKLDDNDYIRVGSTFHTLCAMADQVSPVRGSSGIDTLYSDAFALKCLRTMTGFTFFLIADRRAPDSDLTEVLNAVYTMYSDYVGKNPFSSDGQRVKVEKFEEKITVLTRRFANHFKTHYKH